MKTVLYFFHGKTARFSRVFGGWGKKKAVTDLMRKEWITMNKIKAQDIADMIDHSLLNPTFTLEEIKRGYITDTELEAARKSIDHSYRQSFDHPDVLARFYTGRALVGNTETVDTWRRRLSAVKKSEVVEAAAHVAHRATFFLKGTREEGEGEEEEEEG